MTFSVNQTRQLYVVNDLSNNHLTENSPVGSLYVDFPRGDNTITLEYRGPAGIMRSDVIENVLHAKATDSDTMMRNLAAYTVTLDETVNGGEPVAGQDYLLRIAFRQFIGMGDEETYFKYGMVHAYYGMSASDFYKTLALSLAKNFSRENTELLGFGLMSGSGLVIINSRTKAAELTGEYTGVFIQEVPQNWVLGVIEQVPVYFTVQTDSITFEGDERIWGVVEAAESRIEPIHNGKQIADLEYFCMGERGDMYRTIGFPNIIRTAYLVDPEQPYNVIDIHYAFIDEGVSVQKSEKTITLVMPKGTGSSMNILTNAVSDALGLGMDHLPTNLS